MCAEKTSKLNPSTLAVADMLSNKLQDIGKKSQCC
jgi:hypothetical protein